MTAQATNEAPRRPSMLALVLGHSIVAASIATQLVVLAMFFLIPTEPGESRAFSRMAFLAIAALSLCVVVPGTLIALALTIFSLKERRRTGARKASLWYHAAATGLPFALAALMILWWALSR